MKTVQRTLLSVPGVRNADVSLKQKRAVVAYDPKRTNEDALVRAIETAGFEASVP